MDTKRWGLFVAIVVVIFGGLIFMNKSSKTDVSNIDQFKIIKTKKEAEKNDSGLPDSVYGNTDAKVVLIEYGDYSCPGCKALSKTIDEIKPEYKDKVAFVFRNFPLTSIHPNSLTAAAYAESAGIQGKFWDFHSKVFEQADKWDRESDPQKRDNVFNDIAKEVGLDVDKIKKDIKAEKVSKKISFDTSIGKKSDVSATPTVFLNGKKVKGDDFKKDNLVKLLDETIKKAK